MTRSFSLMSGLLAAMFAGAGANAVEASGKKKPLNFATLNFATLRKTSTPPARANPCAVYGPGFVAVAGSTSCLRMTGRVRVEYGTHLNGRR